MRIPEPVFCFGGGGGGGGGQGAAPPQIKDISKGDGKRHPHSSDNNGMTDYSGPQYSGLLAPEPVQKPKSILGAG